MSRIILIPAYKPNHLMVTLIQELVKQSDDKILIVDDGSGPDFKAVFDEITAHDQVILLTHQENQGKGAALKTGFKYIYEEMPHIQSAITADADGQHAPKDIANLGRIAGDSPKALILGARDFSQMPTRNRTGNSISMYAYQHLLNLPVTDTQTGLRVIPRDFIPACLQIPFDRFEFESEMLILAKRNHVQFINEPIETIYIGKNETSHYRPFEDSAKIYFVIFRKEMASRYGAIADFLFFLFTHALFPTLAGAVFAARGIYFIVNAGFRIFYQVYYSRQQAVIRLARNALLVATTGAAVVWTIPWLENLLGWPVVGVKFLAEAIFFLLIFFTKSAYATWRMKR